MSDFLILKSASEARTILSGFLPVELERVPLETACGRVLAEDLRVPEDLPAWPRATMDGYAVRAADTFGASETVPAFFTVRGAVPMGGVFPGTLGVGDAVAIATGGVLPGGADAVVMVEYTQGGQGAELEVRRSVAPGANFIARGDDLGQGELLLSSGRRIRPCDIGGLAAFGLVSIPVYRRPRVGILSTGNEVVPPAEAPAPGQIRDVNQYTMAAMAQRLGADVVLGGIVRDDPDELRPAIKSLVNACDAVLVSGGSSIGTRDLTALVLAEVGAEIVFHGISVRPGKPTILARQGRKPILGMPGVPVSALVIFDVFVAPLLRRLAGEVVSDPWPLRRQARMSRKIPSIPGREDYVRVRLCDKDGATWAEPLLGGSAALATVLRADGLVVVPPESEGIDEGASVEVWLYA
jgi:molybdopterin molybdotransferase